LIQDLTAIYNDRLKIDRVSWGMEELAKHGTFLPANMQGLNDDQIEELKLVDEWANICVPSGHEDCSALNKDPMGQRNGKQPNEKMQELIHRTIGEAKAAVSNKQAENNIVLTHKVVKEQLDLLKAACTIVYPMNLPPHDPIRLEFENKEELGGTHDSLQVIPDSQAELWFCGKPIHRGKQLLDFIGKNEKTKVVIKIQKSGHGPPAREPIMTEAQQKEIMLHAYRKQEQAKKLEADEDDEYLNSEWADSESLKRSFQGLSNISWKPK